VGFHSNLCIRAKLILALCQFEGHINVGWGPHPALGQPSEQPGLSQCWHI